MNNLRCPQCGLSHIKRNGYSHYGKQNYRCKDCDRQFVEDSQHIGEEVKDLIKVLLLERLSLRGVCSVTRVSLTWLLDFIAKVYAESPDDLNVEVCQARGVVQLLRLEAEADEMWSFVVSKRNKQWIWIALDGATKQVIAFYVGDRSASSARELWRRIPQVYRDRATFYTDGLAAYKTVLPSERHQVCAKSSGHTNMIEGFNCALRQRLSRLAPGALSFSKMIKNHIGAIKYFICHYNKVISGLLSQPYICSTTLSFKGLPLVAGALTLDRQIRALNAVILVFGHSHIDFDQMIEGVRYIHHAFDYPRREGHSKEPLKQIWESVS